MQNPIAILRQLDPHHWLLFWVGFSGWMWDAFDFATVSLTVTEVAKEFGVDNSEMTWGITITLMLRSVGALIFGMISDRYGRKWVMISTLCLFIILELATGFTRTLSEFLAVRALYGIAMGGLYGPAAATALEDLLYDARGILSGLYQQGYATGTLLATVFYRALVPTTTHGWRSLYRFGAGPPVLIIIFRLCLPETNTFLVMKAEREAKAAHVQHLNNDEQLSRAARMRVFGREAGRAIKMNWVILAYMVVLLTGFHSISHGSQDLYPTFLKTQAGTSPTQTTVITAVGQIGAIVGSTLLGYLSTYFGRRLVMIIGCVFGGAIVPAYILPRDTSSLVAAGFFQQFFVQGIFGPIPIHQIELSPPALRSLAAGLTNQLGNLPSSASATIEATIGERFPLPPTATGVERFDCGKVIAIFMGAAWAFILFFVFWGPEMSQNEREEEAALARQYEGMRSRGCSLKEIGARRAKGFRPGEEPGVNEMEEEKAANESTQIERV